ncbi:hypothetical protein HDV01_004689 [Terramyces sp. JEL0728]|nr:hypothetical protein HDV01_004689 [Terramyces sp. JEL0728]
MEKEDDLDDSSEFTKTITEDTTPEQPSKIRMSDIQSHWYAYYVLLILVLIGLTSFTIGTRLIYHSNNVQDVEFSGAKFDYSFGIFTFSYRMTDIGGNEANLAYSTNWTTLTYSEACSTTSFSTFNNNEGVIDLPFFCSNMTLWRFVPPFMIVAITLGAFAFCLLIANGLMFRTFHLWYDPTTFKIINHLNLKQFFKYSIFSCVVLHFAFQGCAIGLTSAVVFLHMIKIPSSVSFGWGAIMGAGSLLNDIFFLIMFGSLYENVFIWRSKNRI